MFDGGGCKPGGTNLNAAAETARRSTHNPAGQLPSHLQFPSLPLRMEDGPDCTYAMYLKVRDLARAGKEGRTEETQTESGREKRAWKRPEDAETVRPGK